MLHSAGSCPPSANTATVNTESGSPVLLKRISPYTQDPIILESPRLICTLIARLAPAASVKLPGSMLTLTPSGKPSAETVQLAPPTRSVTVRLKLQTLRHKELT